jgi:hypothetical protein
MFGGMMSVLDGRTIDLVSSEAIEINLLVH